MRTRRRIHPYVRPELAQRLTTYCAAKGITESAAVETAVEAHLGGEERNNEVILRRLDRIGRASARQQRDLEMLTESFGVFIEMWFSVVPDRSTEERAAGQRLAQARYQHFVDIVSARLARGPQMVADMVKVEGVIRQKGLHDELTAEPYVIVETALREAVYVRLDQATAPRCARELP